MADSNEQVEWYHRAYDSNVMKTYIDMFETYKGLFLASKRLKNRFRRYWGVTTIDGVEVFNKQLTVWPNTDSNRNTVAILKMFGMYNAIKSAEFKGISRYYLHLNPSKLSNYDAVSKDILLNHTNAVIPNDWFTVVLNYTDPDNPTKFNGWTSEEIWTWLQDNYEALKDSPYLESRGGTVVADAIGYYILLDDANNFEVRFSSATVMPVPYTKTVIIETTDEDTGEPVHTTKRNTLYSSGISVEIQVRQISPLQKADRVFRLIVAETDYIRKNKIETVFSIDKDTSDFESAASATAGIANILGNRTGKTDAIWYKGQLRTAVLDSSYLSKNKFAELLAGAMDTGYDKKKTKWYKKVLSIVIVVAAVILSVVTGGGSLTLMQFAFNLGVAMLTLTAIQFVIAKSGDLAWAQYFGSVVQIVSMVSMVLGIASFIQNMAARVAQQSLVQAASTAVKEAFTELATAATKLASEVSLGNTLNFLGSRIMTLGRMFVEKIMDMRVSTAAKELADVQEAARQSKEELADLTDKEVNIGVEDIKYYTQPLKLDNLPFEVDYLYEGTLMNIGRPSFVPIGLNLLDKA